MDAKKFMDWLRSSNIIRLRFFNIKLWGNLRYGLYREYTFDDMLSLIKDFKQLSTPPTVVTSQQEEQSFKSGSNYAILSRLCESYQIATRQCDATFQSRISNPQGKRLSTLLIPRSRSIGYHDCSTFGKRKIGRLQPHITPQKKHQ